MEDKMDKKNQNKVLKKPARAEDGFWDCSVCTYRNGSEAFKCLMCDVRKGTSTRKPRINAQLVAQQVAQQFVTTPPLKKTPSKSKNLKRIRPRLTNVDRDSAQHMAVTVSDVTVIITDYKLLSPAHSPPVTPDRTSPVSPAEKKSEPGPSSSTEVNGNGTAAEESS